MKKKSKMSMPSALTDDNIQGLVKRYALTIGQLNSFQTYFPNGVSYIQPLPLSNGFTKSSKGLKPYIYSVSI